MTRAENLISGDLYKALDERRWRLQRDTERLRQLDTEPPTEFDRGDELKAMYDELDQLERQLRQEATSPEAIARREALEKRLQSKGRQRGWSLMLNATPALCKENGYDSPAQVRALMAQYADDAIIENFDKYEAAQAIRQTATAPNHSNSSDAEGATVMELVAKAHDDKRIGPVNRSSESATVIPFRASHRDVELDR